ncbi:PEP-CTERM sorting domain-containing protein [Paucibacter sp. TC2R-5]|uniref:PEP-CTERM sorting domain-containing protein n=1 Tax=Paucibacter sp. TC2R-5 TaxID=2893555 RepID=UPI0021E40FCC|nr:PEP-CTERM sorting domain-containing protein [Paucibacter sp. TC2R-5]MCV2359710.1 PEP-CTERM sorting domain-containing protein [Paucibacter sp. TC2R-5]
MTLKVLNALVFLSTLTLVGAAHAGPMVGLQARDLDGNVDNGPEAFYDPALNITWLADANVRGRTPEGTYNGMGGLSSWYSAMEWVANLQVGGFDDWRLPSALNRDGSAPCTGFSCTSGEMGQLYYVSLGNAFQSTERKVGGFVHLETYLYWTSTSVPDSGAYDRKRVFSPNLYGNGYNGHQDSYPGFISTGAYAMAVRDGDVASPVPEPQTLALTLIGLTGVLLARRRRVL